MGNIQRFFILILMLFLAFQEGLRLNTHILGDPFGHLLGLLVVVSCLT